MLGNSITNGGNWSELLDNPDVLNRGISGDNTFGILNRLDEIVSLQPSKVFLMIGINDLSRETPVDVILNNYRRIVTQLQKESPETSIYVQSLFPTNNEFDHFPRAQNKDNQIRVVNKGIEDIAIEYGITFIDLYPHFLDEESKLSKKYTNDGLHLMGEGYLKWAEILKEFINE
jgi:lysophospholipase L1-like esterase